MGAAFDKLIDKRDYVPEGLRVYLRRAKLFEYDILPTQALDGIPLEDCEKLVKTFSVPFPVTAVEDKSGVVILTSEGNPDQTDLTAVRMAIVAQFNRSNPGYYRENPSDTDFLARMDHQKGEIPPELEGSFTVLIGQVEVRWDSSVHKWVGPRASVLCGVLWKANGEQVYHITPEQAATLKGEARDLFERDLTRSVITAYEELLPLGNQEKVILETRKLRPNEKLPKFRKTCYRPTYTLLKPFEARKVMGLPDPVPKVQGGRVITERRAHWRAEHDRVLRHEKWGESKGKTIHVDRTWVHAVWNGDMVAERAGHKYVVILGDEG